MPESWIQHFLSLIALPRLGVSLSLLFVKALLSANRSVDALPDSVVEAAKRLEVAYEALKARHRAVRFKPEDDGVKVGDVYNRARGVLRGLYDFLGSVIAIGGPDGVKAEQVRSRLFPTGLSVIKLSSYSLFGELRTTVEVIADYHEAFLLDLGGRRIWTALNDVHVEFGDALGVTAPLPKNNEATRAHLLQVMMNAVRVYVATLMSWAALDPEGAKAAEILLSPMDRFTQISQQMYPGPKKDGAANSETKLVTPKGKTASISPPPASVVSKPATPKGKTTSVSPLPASVASKPAHVANDASPAATPAVETPVTENAPGIVATQAVEAASTPNGGAHAKAPIVRSAAVNGPPSSTVPRAGPKRAEGASIPVTVNLPLVIEPRARGSGGT